MPCVEIVLQESRGSPYSKFANNLFASSCDNLRPIVSLGGGMWWIVNTIMGLILLALAVAGAWRWYDSYAKSQSENQFGGTAEREIRETAECHLEAFKLRPGVTETDLEVQAAFMDLCMEARGYFFLPGCDERTPNAPRIYNLGYKFNSICWGTNPAFRR